ncbi:MAG TPA: PKD domain-containing protein [Thermoleophilaceae bacterium]|nr:PKD domain-containing protein [Thermoleophilaceae bacterium]
MLAALVAALVAGAVGAPAQAQTTAPTFTISPNRPNPGQPVQFTAKNVPAGTVVAWDFEDADSLPDATGRRVQHSFPTVGRKPVTMLATGFPPVTRTVRVVAPTEPAPPPTPPPAPPTTPPAPPLPTPQPPGGSPLINRAPVATFAYTPRSPRTGDVLEFLSGSYDPDGQALSQVWDLDGDNQFDDAAGARVSWRYRTTGVRRVRLRVTDPAGATAVQEQLVSVSAGAAAARFLIPFPVVGLTGRVYSRATLVTSLVVRAPRGSVVTARCSGRGCPREPVTRRVGKRTRLTFPTFKRRLGVGARLGLSIRRAGYIGKYTRYRIRAGAAPARTDLCLMPGSSKPKRCPTR